ncbi:hypothetical protein ScPMuIL_013458 [Solemya velum]
MPNMVGTRLNMANYEAYLKTSLVKYKYADIARRDILNVFQQFQDLRPKLDPYIFNDGNRKDLLSLDGTIPVNYKGSTYNIPICIWILDTHPYNPPMVYVKPTSTMQIKQGRNVDANGKVDLPYLRDWRYPQSDLLGLIQILGIVFGEEPPVYSRMPPRPTYTPGQPPGVPQATPYPPAQSSFPMPQMAGAGPTGNPPYPPPYQGGGYPFGGYPPQQPPQQQQQQGFSGYPSQQSTPYPPAPNNPQPHLSYPYGTSPSQQGGYPPPATSTTATNSSNQMNTVTEEHIKASLLSAVEDKMRRRLRETFAQAQAEIDVLYKTQGDLIKGKDKLEKMTQDLEKELNEIEGNIQLLKSKDSEIKEALTKLDSQDKLNIDETVVTTTPLYRQIFNCFSEEQAIEDAIYYLGEALRKGVIDLDVFLKQVRELSRQQFTLRALIQKGREKAGLPPLA